jgi:hypothetical protein
MFMMIMVKSWDTPLRLMLSQAQLQLLLLQRNKIKKKLGESRAFQTLEKAALPQGKEAKIKTK